MAGAPDNLKPNDIDITPEMIEAGEDVLDELYRPGFTSSAQVVEAI
jgi:hypothetical protein